MSIDAEAIRAAAEFASAAVVHKGASEVPFIVVPDGFKLHELESLQADPRRIRETMNAESVAAFVGYVSHWFRRTSVVMASRKGQTLRAILDYHSRDAAPSWCSHICEYRPELSRQLKAWQQRDGRAQTQIEFADFIEENVADFVNPVGAAMLEQATKLQFIQKAVFGSAVKLQSGEFALAYSQENQKGTVELPEKLELGFPVFENGPPYKVEARLRYRLQEGGKIQFFVRLIDLQRTIDHAFEQLIIEARAGIEARTGSPIAFYLGTASRV